MLMGSAFLGGAVPIRLYTLHIMDLAHAFGFNAKTYVLTAIATESLHFLDAIDSSGNPYVYLIVGYSKTKLDCQKPFETLLERALLDDGTTQK
ncbi:hypothetical protein L345_09858, partial [Ophiophagus hannah]